MNNSYTSMINTTKSRENHEKSKAVSNVLIAKLESEIEKFALDATKSTITLDNINSSKDRYRIYEIVKRLELIAESFMYPSSTNKYIIIKKPNKESQQPDTYDSNKTTVDFVNFFVKYTEIPIPTNHPDHFDYYVENLDRYFNSKYYLNTLYQDIILFDSDGKLERKNFALYKKQLWRLKEKIQKTILDNKEYQAFHNMPTENLPQITTTNELYANENDGKLLISIDVKSANFRVLKHYCPTLFENCMEWSEFIQKFTEYKFPLISKPFRVILINELDNKYGHLFPIIFVNKLINVISQTKYADTLSQFCCKNDEVIFEITKPNEFNYDEFVEIVNQTETFFRTRVFRLKKTSNKNYFVKEFVDTSESTTVEFKNVPKRHIMQVVKNYDNKELEELDFKYIENTGVIFQSESIY